MQFLRQKQSFFNCQEEFIFAPSQIDPSEWPQGMTNKLLAHDFHMNTRPSSFIFISKGQGASPVVVRGELFCCIHEIVN